MMRILGYRFFRIVVGVVAFVPLTGFSQSLPQSVEIALSQYPTIVAAQSRVKAAGHQIAEAQSQHWPQLAWQGTNNVYSGVAPSPFEPNNTWIQSPAISLNIWSGGRIQSQVQRARAVHDTRRQEERITRDEVAYLVVDAYLNWVRLEQLKAIAQQNLAIHQKLTGDVSKIAQIDQGRRIDVTQAMVRAENARLTLEQLVSEHEIAGQRLQRMLLGSLPSQPSGYKDIPGQIPASLNAALQRVNSQHPVIAQREAQVRTAQAEVAGARSQFLPSVDLSYQKQTTEGLGQGDYVTQLNVRVPIFDGGRAHSATRSAYADLDVAQQDLRESELILRENLSNAWSEYSIAKQRIILGEQQVNNAAELARGYDQQFRIGRRSLLDLLTIQDNLFGYRVNLTNATFEKQVAKAKILAILNELATAYTEKVVATDAPQAKVSGGLVQTSNPIRPVVQP